MKQNVYDSNISYLLEELKRIDKLIAQNIKNILDEKDNIKNNAPQLGIPLWAIKKLKQSNDIEELTKLREIIDQKIANSYKAGVELYFVKIKKLFGLTNIECDIFFICLIGHFDSLYINMWKDLQYNSSAKNPSVETILNLLSSSLEEKLNIKKYLHIEAPLFKNLLLECVENKLPLDDIVFNNTIRVSPRILNFLLGECTIAPFLTTILKHVTANQEIEKLFLSPTLTQQIMSLSLEEAQQDQLPHIIALKGKEGSGQLTIAEAICKKCNIDMLVVNIDDLLSYPLKELDLIFPLIGREAKLQNTAIYWYNTHLLKMPDKSHVLSLFLKQLNRLQTIHFIALSTHEYFPYQYLTCKLMELEIPPPNTQERYLIWQDIFPQIIQKELMEVAQSFQFGRGDIYNISSYVKSLYSDDYKYTIDDIYKACHIHSRQYISNYAIITKPLYSLENITLSAQCRQEIEEIINWVKYKDIVYVQGGFNKKISLGKGLIALFFGSPGTGKTMAAEVIAGELNLYLYKINLSTVMSKFVGETEKHLDKVFNEAENSNAILFFDEADSLFGKRGEVKDARDNYANIQTSYLLQKVEEYPGIVILASNLKNNIDEAFIRRLHFSIEFSMPSAEERHQIWKNIWPQNIALKSDINLEKLANHLEIAGGNIRNIALAASFRAAAEIKTNLQLSANNKIEISSEHLLFAVKKELRKTGRIIIYEQLNKIF